MFCSYDYEVLDASRVKQQQNPDVIVPFRPSVTIIQLRKILEAAARDIRYLLSEEICVPDDEDTVCIQPDDYCQIPIIPQVDIDFSGSGEPPTLLFLPPTEVDPTTSTITNATETPTASSTSTVPNSQTVPYETNTTPSRPHSPTTANPRTEDPNQSDGDGGASTIHQSLYMLLLLVTSVVLIL